jgi:hypothetical protein
MLPLTVERSSSRPPLPIVPRTRRGPSVLLLVTLTGNSELRLPVSISARSSAANALGNVNVILPFTVLTRFIREGADFSLRRVVMVSQTSDLEEPATRRRQSRWLKLTMSRSAAGDEDSFARRDRSETHRAGGVWS